MAKKVVAKAAPEKREPTGRETRVDLIRGIEAQRNSRLITYVTNTRPGLEVHMAQDVVRYVFDLLASFREQNKGKKCPQIDLFIHSNGGDGTVPWRLVTLIREFCDRFTVLVPYRAFSAATLTALGADEVVMHPMGMLGPTDATVANPFNPVDPAAPNRRLGISVEDVTAYIQLVKDDVGIQHEDELIQAFASLATNVHPLALGNVKRTMSQSRMMARKLLELHMGADSRHKVDEIVDNLTSKLFFHGHPINRTEAREQIQIPTVKDACADLEAAMWKLYCEYEEFMNLIRPLDLLAQFGVYHDVLAMADNTPTITPDIDQIFVSLESGDISFTHRDRYKLLGIKAPGGNLNVTHLPGGASWIRES
jgi:Periplasmic serine proteases (ClpP class)